MAGNDTNFEPSKVNEDTVNYDDLVNDNNASSGVITMGSSMVVAPSCPSGPMLDSFCPQIWDQPINVHNLGYSNTNFDTSSSMNWMPKTLLRDSVFIPSVSRNSPHSLPPFPPDSAFIERAVRFSCFSGGSFGEMVTPFSVPEPLDCLPRAVRGPNEVNETEGGLLKNEKKGEGLVKCSNEGKVGVDASNNQCDAGETSESSGKGVGVMKRKIIEQKTENNEGTKQEEDTAKDKGDQNPCSTSTHGGKHGKQESQVSDPPKEEYIHVRARRGQATNSHSLAERIRREKISERMKYLQDLVPGCSKVTGKAVMLDEIINYVQSLQRQVEFLSMKLATVNPQLEFNMEGFLANDIIQSRAGLSSSLVFPPDIAMPFHPLFSSQPGQNPAGLPRLRNSSETLGRPPIGLESTVVCGELSPLTSQQMQAPGVWDDELDNVVHNGFNTSAPLDTQDLSGCES